MSENRVRLEQMSGTRYARFLTYPSSQAMAEAEERVQQLETIGINSLTFKGPTTIDGVQVLGKGCVGVVIQASLGNIPVAVKIRRMDADRSSLLDEARLLRLANSVGVGPTLIAATQNVLVMQLLNGLPLSKWAEHRRNRSIVKRVLRQLLVECFKLDAIGLDHGELSHAPRNVLVDSKGKECIVDFETASTSRRVSNVTSLLQYFLFGQLAMSLGAKLYRNRRSVLRRLSEYKQDGSVACFQSILATLGLN